MTGPNRVTGPLLDVLEVFLQAFNDDAELHGWAITKATKRSGPTVYGILDRLEDAAWITGQWEDQRPESNKPRRRLYRLTPNGVIAARDLLATRRPQALHHYPRPPPRVAPAGYGIRRLAAHAAAGRCPMTIGEVLLASVTGLAVNECCDVSPWIARKLVR